MGDFQIAELTKRETYLEYEQRKKIVESQGLTPKQYEKEMLKIVEDLKL